jgi:hypothetical protein
VCVCVCMCVSVCVALEGFSPGPRKRGKGGVEEGWEKRKTSSGRSIRNTSSGRTDSFFYDKRLTISK